MRRINGIALIVIGLIHSLALVIPGAIGFPGIWSEILAAGVVDAVSGSSGTGLRIWGYYWFLMPGFALIVLGLVCVWVERALDRVLPALVGWSLAALAAFFPAELGKKADPFLPAPAGIKPEWYFMFMFQSLKYLPGHILGIEGEIVGILGFGLGGLFLLLIPFLDRRTARSEPSPLFTWIGIAIIAYMLLFTYLGYTASATK